MADFVTTPGRNGTTLLVLLRPWCALRGHRYTRRTTHASDFVLHRGSCLCHKRGEFTTHDARGHRPYFRTETEEVR